jgi:hypothetical protein
VNGSCFETTVIAIERGARRVSGAGGRRGGGGEMFCSVCGMVRSARGPAPGVAGRLRGGALQALGRLTGAMLAPVYTKVWLVGQRL